MYVCDAATGTIEHRLEALPGSVMASRFVEDERHVIAVGRDGNAAVWTLDSAEPPRRFTVCAGRVAVIAFSRSGRHLACASRRRVRIRDVVSNETTDVSLAEGITVSALALSPAVDWLAVGDDAGGVTVIPITPPTAGAIE